MYKRLKPEIDKMDSKKNTGINRIKSDEDFISLKISYKDNIIDLNGDQSEVFDFLDESFLNFIASTFDSALDVLDSGTKTLESVAYPKERIIEDDTVINPTEPSL
jgi:hypothetical protein